MPVGSERIKENLRHYLEVGTSLSSSLSKMSRADLEKVVRELAESVPSVGRERVEDAVEELRARGMRQATKVAGAVRGEFDEIASKHRQDLADLVEWAGSRLGDLLGGGRVDSAPRTPSPAAGATKASKKSAGARAAKKAVPAQGAATKAGGAKKAAPAKRAAKKTAVNKAAPTKATATKSGAKKASPSKASAKRPGGSA